MIGSYKYSNKENKHTEYNHVLKFPEISYFLNIFVKHFASREKNVIILHEFLKLTRLIVAH